MPPVAPSQCLDDRAVHDFVARLLDPARADAVRAHLDGCDACCDLVATVAGGSDTARPPETIGRYQIEQVVGSGAMGIVYEAVDPQLGRKVAIKMLRAGDPERLLREARAVAQLSHPNVIAVFDSGIADGEVFMVMELIRGVALREWLAARSRPWSEVLDIVLRAGRGLAAVHAAGLVHRDIKPDNILVANDGRALLTDFGLVHVEPTDARGLAGSVDLTQTGAVVGTPAYLAPEILAGEEPTPRSDQFSYCVSLFEALCGERPFIGKTVGELREAIGRGPSALARVPDRVAAAIARGLAVTPAARWPTVDALVDEIEQRVRSRRRGRRIAAGAGAIAVAAVVGGMAVRAVSSGMEEPTCDAGAGELARVWNPELRERISGAFARSGVGFAASTWTVLQPMLDRYASRWATSYDEACNATHRKRSQTAATLDVRTRCLERRRNELASVLDTFAQPDADVISRAVSSVAALVSPAVCDDAATLVEIDPVPDAPEVRGEVMAAQQELARASALRKAGRYKASLELARTVAVTADRLAYAPLIAEAQHVRALAALDLEQLDEVKQALDASLLAAERGRDHRTRADVHLRLAQLAMHRSDPRGGLHDLDRGDAIIAGIGGATRDRAIAAELRGTALGELGKLPEAVEALELANRLYAEASGPNTIDSVGVTTKLGYIAYQRGDVPAAIEQFNRVLAIQRSALGPDHPGIGRTHTDLAFAQAAVRRFDDATASAEAARKNLALSLGDDSAPYWEATRALVGIHRRRGDYGAAEPIARDVLAAMEKHRPNDPRVADALDDLAQTLKHVETKRDEALALRERSLAIRVATNDDPNHTSVQMAKLALAEATSDLRRFDDALPLFEAVQKLADQPERPPYLAVATRLGRGLCLIELERFDEAVRVLEESVELADPQKMDPTGRAQSRLLLAKALWGTGKRAAAKAAAETGRVEATSVGAPELVDEATKWLTDHP